MIINEKKKSGTFNQGYLKPIFVDKKKYDYFFSVDFGYILRNSNTLGEKDRFKSFATKDYTFDQENVRINKYAVELRDGKYYIYPSKIVRDIIDNHDLNRDKFDEPEEQYLICDLSVIYMIFIEKIYLAFDKIRYKKKNNDT